MAGKVGKFIANFRQCSGATYSKNLDASKILLPNSQNRTEKHRVKAGRTHQPMIAARAKTLGIIILFADLGKTLF